jgi:primosomal protein N' (replication factor Y)
VKYVDIVVETKSDNVDELYTYISENDDICPGRKVRVPFSRSKLKEGYVVAVKDSLPSELEGKRILKVTEEIPEVSLPEDAAVISIWMRRRYFCRYIDALECFAPAGSESKRGKKRVPDTSDAEMDESLPELTKEQKGACESISDAIAAEEFRPFLLWGVTGSGKTELYMRAASETLAKGRQVIVLVPEISLTPQIIDRFVRRFGREKLAILHSKLSMGERYDEWMRIKTGGAEIAIGARSAVFAPFSNIGLIVVDEEHETTYKSDMNPKYDTIEVALKRGYRNNVTVILGSATPSITSMHRAKTGIYELLTLKERIGSYPMPEVVISDMREELANGNRSIFSVQLHADITETLENNRQVILFLNRRGYSPFVTCRDCGHTIRCPECGLTMTWHKAGSTMECHFCGNRSIKPNTCPICGGENLKHFGIGTEKVEELTRKTFPNARVSRLDLDTAKPKGSINKILEDFEKKKSDILIGTQMVAKGLDFSGVDLVGILTADVSLNIPDYRSAERTFQLIVQASGRSGRGDRRGGVIIQTYEPEHYAVKCAAENDYDTFFDTELMLRKYMQYPPFSDVAQVTIISQNEESAEVFARRTREEILGSVGNSFETCVLGPQRAAVYKLGEDYRWRIFVKILPESLSLWQRSLAFVKKKTNTERRDYRIIIDMNPFSLV